MKKHIAAIALFALTAFAFAQAPSTPAPSTPAPATPPPLVLVQPTPAPAPASVTITLTADQQAALLYAVSLKDAKHFAEYNAAQQAAYKAWLKQPLATRGAFVPPPFIPIDPSNYITRRIEELLANYGSQKSANTVNSGVALFKKLTPAQQAAALASLAAAANATPAPATPAPAQ